MKVSSFIWVLCYFLLVACSNKQINLVKGNAQFPKDKITKVYQPVKKDHWQDDFDVIDYLIKNDTLYVKVRYGGGCGKVKFMLNTLDDSKKSSTLALECRDDDNCRAYKFRFLAYNLSGLSDKKHLIIKFPEEEIIIR